jgi:membrane-bound lytic murein transglycosylase B
MRIGDTFKALALGTGSALVSVLATPSAAHANNFQACVERFWPAARASGVSRATFDRATKGLTPDPEVIERANYQPEYVRPIGEYVDRVVSDKRIETGKQKLVEYKTLLDQLESRYGVDRHILIAVWGVESNYGMQAGDKNVIRSLTTLACSGTKAKFARSQIVPALKILQRGDVSFEAMNGSWAGAMGHTQFIPTTYTAYAVDEDGDGKRDIWNNVPDALASTASYLKRSGWHPDQTWGYEVQLPKGFPLKRVSEKTYKTLAQWQRYGIVRVNGAVFPRPGDKAQLFAPEGDKGPVFLVLNNFHAILHYNVANSYALAVGHLADRLAGYGPFVHPWPTDETHLSLEQRTELQQRLIALKYLEGDADGVIGPATLDGVRAYQRAKGLPVDGFPTQTILKMLRKDAETARATQALPAQTPPAQVQPAPAQGQSAAKSVPLQPGQNQ